MNAIEGNGAKRASARAEWRAGWPLPFVGMLGNSGTMLFMYSSNILLAAITSEFGWTRTEFSIGVTLTMLLSIVVMPIVGFLVDRLGPRKVGLAGIVLAIVINGSFGLQPGPIWMWWLQCALNSLVTGMISPLVWCAAVATRFDAARGLAFGIALSGTGFAAAIYPLLATFYLEQFGWRMTYPALALTWGLPVLPLAFLYFSSARDVQPGEKQAPPERVPFSAYRSAIFSRSFFLLLLAGALFGMASLVILMNIAPILKAGGMTPIRAATIAGLAGIFAMIGRLSIGALIDRYSARTIAIYTFGLPALTCLLLLYAPGSVPIAIAAAVIMGIANGAEFDILSFLISRYYGVKYFGGVFGAILSVVSVAVGCGPLIAAIVIDKAGGYDELLMLMAPCFAISALMMIGLPKLHKTAEPG